MRPALGGSSVGGIARDEALRLSDLNLAAYLRHANSYATSAACREEDGLLMFAGTHSNPHPYVNCLLRLNSSIAAHEALERGRSFFGERRRGFAVWIRDHADADLEKTVKDAGLWQRPPLEGQPGLLIEHALPAPPTAPGVEIRRVQTQQEAMDYLHVVGEAWGMAGSPPELVWSQFLRPEAVLADDVLAFIAYLNGVPTGGCLAFLAHEVAGLYWAASSATAKGLGIGRGLGTACFIASLNAGLEAGARMAAGQASAKGTPIWRRLGAEVITNYRRYVNPPPARIGGKTS